MKNRIFPALAAGVLALTTLTACGGGQPPQSEEKGGDLLAAIQAKGEIVVAMEGTWAPWTYHDEAGELVGYDVEVAQAVAEELGVKVSFAESGWVSLLAGLESCLYDIIVNGVEIDEARQEKFDFSAPYAYNRTAVIVRGDNEEIQSMEDLEGKQTANTISSTYAAVAQKYGAEVTGVDDLNQTFALLTSGRIDATLNADVSYHDYMRAHPEADIKIACLDPDPTQVAIPMRKGEESAALREAIDKALTQLSEDGTLTELSTKYFGVDISQK